MDDNALRAPRSEQIDIAAGREKMCGIAGSPAQIVGEPRRDNASDRQGVDSRRQAEAGIEQTGDGDAGAFSLGDKQGGRQTPL
jgi:hypothetical protein